MSCDSGLGADVDAEAAVIAEPCRVYWGSHGCVYERGHDGRHKCGCCNCADHEKDHELEPGLVCVGAYPYYGPDTEFYGEDA